VRIGRMGLDLDLWLRGWIALQRVFMAIVILFAHAAYKWAVALLFVEEFAGTRKLLTVTGEVALMSLNAWLLVEAVRVFLPEPYGIRLNVDGRNEEHATGSTSDF
jgi:hypothetical protein